MKKYISIFIISVCMAPAYSQVGVHLSWNNSVKNPTASSMSVTWSDRDPVEGIVMYGTDKDLKKSESALREYSPEMKAHIYKATLTKLKPNTVYFYRCGSADGWSEIRSFKTAPALGSKDRFVVGVWGDTQDNEFNTSFEKSDVIVQQMRKHDVNFTVHMGDIVNNGSVVESWDALFRTTEPINATAPFMPVAGNHDVVNDSSHPGFQKPFPVFHALFNLPEDHVNYSFDYGNTHFVAIGSGFAKEAEKSGAVLFKEGSSERAWLEKDLAKAKDQKHIQWIIVYMHYPLYSYGWSHVPEWQHRITPLLDKYEVDLCLAGHRHVYERHSAIRENQVLPSPSRNSYEKPLGTVYITNGTAGGSPQGVGGHEMPSMIYTSAHKMYNYAIMRVEDNLLTYVVYNQVGETIDSFKIVK